MQLTFLHNYPLHKSVGCQKVINDIFKYFFVANLLLWPRNQSNQSEVDKKTSLISMKEPNNVSTSVVLNNFIRSVSISVLRLILFHVHI